MEGINCCCNILWVILVGWELCLMWFISGIFLCITIIGIPFGLQAFKISCFIIWPFGRDISYSNSEMTCLQICGNILWILIGGLWIAIGECIAGIIFCCTIIGIPFGLQLFKFAKLAFLPFGAEIVDVDPRNIEPMNPITTGPGYA